MSDLPDLPEPPMTAEKALIWSESTIDTLASRGPSFGGYIEAERAWRTAYGVAAKLGATEILKTLFPVNAFGAPSLSSSLHTYPDAIDKLVILAKWCRRQVPSNASAFPDDEDDEGHQPGQSATPDPSPPVPPPDQSEHNDRDEEIATASNDPEKHRHKKGPFGLGLITDRHTAQRGGQAVEFGGRERPWQIFVKLCARYPGYFRITDLGHEVWNPLYEDDIDDPDQLTVVNHVKDLRKVIAPLGVTVKHGSEVLQLARRVQELEDRLLPRGKPS